MAIDYVVKYGSDLSTMVDEKLKEGSKTDGMCNKDYDFTGAQSVKVYTISTAPMNTYSMTGTSRYGSPSELDAPSQEMVMSQDRSFTFTIDKRNNDETGGALEGGKALARQLREVVVPEIDTYRFTKMATLSGTKATAVAITKDNIYDLIVTGTEVLDDNEVPQQNRVLTVSNAVYKAMKLSPSIVLDTEIGQEARLRGVVAMVDGMEVMKVPTSRLPLKFGFLIGHQIASTSPVKIAEYKIHDDAPGISGKLVEGRVYYDCFVLNNKAKALYYQAIL